MSTEKKRVLFVCVHNSFRSQIAESILNDKYGDLFEAESAGLKTTQINPLAIEVMKEYGLDISNNSVDDVSDYYKQGRTYSYVITVCNRETEKNCPIFPGVKQIINWRFDDPETFTGTHEENYNQAKKLRDLIEKKIDQFADSIA